MIKGNLCLIALLFQSALVFAFETNSIRFDGRSEGLVASGVETKGVPSGMNITAWDTAEVADGWQTLNSESQSASVLVLNGVAVEGGRLSEDVTWTAGRIHVVRHDVVVPSGITLTIEFGCIVKLAGGTRIWIEQGGRIFAKGVYVTDLADDSLGGDTNYDGISHVIDSRWWDDPANADVDEWLKPTATCISWADAGLCEIEFCDTGDDDYPARVYSTDDAVCMGTLPTPSREGYKFLGWYTGANGTGYPVSSATPVKDVGLSIYAAWEEDVVSGAELQDALDCDYLDFVQETQSPGVPTWTVTDEYSYVLQNPLAMTVSDLQPGQWASICAFVKGPCYVDWMWGCVTNQSLCAVQLYCDGEYLGGSSNGKWGTPYIYLGDGEHLMDWCFIQSAITPGGNGGFAVLDNIAVYYSLSYDANGAEGEIPPHDIPRFRRENQDGTTNYFYAVGSEVSLPMPDVLTNVGRDFEGWLCENNGEIYAPGTIYCVPTTTTVFRALWSELKTYVVTYDPGADGIGLQRKSTQAYGDPLNLSGAIFTRKGYTQTGWTNEDGSQTYMLGGLYTANEDITLYPIWTPIEYTVVFNANGGSGSMDPQSFTYDVEQNLRLNMFTHDGYEFLGWALSPTDEAPWLEDGEQVENLADEDGCVLQLFAVWSALPPPAPTPSNCITVEATDLDGLGHVMAGDWITFTLRYAFPEDGTVPVQELVIANQLSDALDWSTFVIEEIYADETADCSLSGHQAGTCEFFNPSRTDVVKVWASVSYSEDAGAIRCYIRAYDDSKIGDWPSDDDGIVKPNGCAYLKYRVRVRAGAVLGTEISTMPLFSADLADLGAALCPISPSLLVVSEQPDAPTGLTVSFDRSSVGDRYIATLSWDGDWPAGTKYVIYRSSSVLIDWNAPYAVTSETSYTDPDEGLSGGATVYYAVCALLEGPYVQGIAARTSAVVPILPSAVATPVIMPANGSSFGGESCEVTITCATEGATIYYSTNGSSPRMNDQFKYTQPFTITDTTTVKAIAVKDGSTQSEIATAVITKINVETGKWNYDYASAKAFADENDLPLVVFWTNPGCAQCERMTEAFETQKYRDWQTSSDYVFVFSEGDIAVKELVKNDSGLYPFVAVKWPSQEIDVRFTARDGLMPVTEGDLVDQFTQSVDLSLFGVVLSVESDYGSPVPSVGDHMYMAGSVVTAAVDFVVNEPGGQTRHVCLAGTGTGSAPERILTSVGAVFEITEDSSITWNWLTQNMLAILEPENGTIGGAESGWFLEDETKTLTATPAGGYKFDGWTGDTDGCTIDGSTITVPMSKPREIGALFVQDVQEQVATPVITPADGSTFDTDSCTVSITCATEGATIYYSTNGSSPRLKDQFKYTQPFTVTETTTIKAVAVKDGFTQSEIATAVLTKVDPPPLTLLSSLDEPKLSAVETDGDAEWEPVKDATAVGGSSARSGVVGMLQRTCLRVTVSGKGTLSFNWKVSCEADYSGEYTYDHMTFSTVESGRTNNIAKIDGETEWLPESVTFTTDGPHVILWTYSTDDWEEPGFEDCGWVDNVAWTGDAPPSDIVISDVVTLPRAEVEAFMAKYPSLAAQVGGDAEAFAKLPSATGKLDANGNQMYVWQDIIAGTDPTNPDDKFKIVDIKFEDGELKVIWSPDLNENGTKNVRAYTEYGRKELGSSEEWADMKDVNPAEKNDYKFRKVTVDMP